MLNLVYAYFPEDHVRYVVATEDVLNFFPNHPNDFDELTKYSILWPLLPKDGSFSTEQRYKAYIKCLGENYEDMYQKVVALKLKMPQNLLAEVKKERSGSSTQQQATKSKGTRPSDQLETGRLRQRGSITSPPPPPSNKALGRDDGPKSKGKSGRQNSQQAKENASQHKNSQQKKPPKIAGPTLSSPVGGNLNNSTAYAVSKNKILDDIVTPSSQESTFSQPLFHSTMIDAFTGDHTDNSPPKKTQKSSGEDGQEWGSAAARPLLSSLDKEGNTAAQRQIDDLMKELGNTRKLVVELSETNLKLRKQIEELESAGKRGASRPRKKAAKKLVIPQPPRDYKTCYELAPMIRDDISQKAPLNEDGAGNVHIGNGVYVDKSVWTNKIRSEKGTLSVRDLAQTVWKTEGLATRTLEGGVTPNPKALNQGSVKTKASPEKVEAILGVYCGKLLSEGVPEKHLPLGVKSGRATLQQKFKESFNKLKAADELQDDQDSGYRNDSDTELGTAAAGDQDGESNIGSETEDEVL